MMKRRLRVLWRKLTTVECCHVCEQPKNRSSWWAGDEQRHGWPYCVNRRCPAYREPMASAAFRRGIPFLQWRVGR
jgi:hypothetical protein